MDAETFRWILLLALAFGVGGIYDRLGALHDKAMRARLDHDRRVLEQLEAIERRLQAICLETEALPGRTKQAFDARPMGEVLGEIISQRD